MEQIGKYRVIRLLGEGGMGRVYEALDPMLNRRVAIKTIAQSILQNPETRARFLREAQAAGQLSHPNLITIHDIAEDGGMPFIVMEYLEGEELTGLVAKGRVALELKLQLIIEACHGLAYAHSKGLVHRDIKPANIFVTSQHQVKILDFGLARGLESDLTRTGNIVGTPSYMAPEQVRGEPIDQRADIFSLGVVLYELLSGRKPFKGDTTAATIYQVLEHRPLPLDQLDPNLPAALTAVVERALAKNPAERYQRIDEMLTDLADIKTMAEGTMLLTAPPDVGGQPATPSPSGSRRTAPPSGPRVTPASRESRVSPSSSATTIRPGSRVAPDTPPASTDTVLIRPKSGHDVIRPSSTAHDASPPSAEAVLVRPQSAPDVSRPSSAAQMPRPAGTNWVVVSAAVAVAAVAVLLAAARFLPRSATSEPAQTTAAAPVAATPATPAAVPAPAAPSSTAATPGATRPTADAASGARQTPASPVPGPREPPRTTALTASAPAVSAPAAPSTAPSASNPARANVPPSAPAARPAESAAAPVPSPPERAAAPVETAPPPAPAPVAPAQTVAAPAPPPAAVPAPAAVENPTVAVNDLLMRYKSALEARDLGALKQIWPGLGGRQETALKAEFDNARAISANLNAITPAVTGSTATVVCRREYVVTTTDGKRLTTTTRMTMSLERKSGAWQITNIRHDAER